MHWNLPSNPIDLEQREGRINRYKCLAVRQNIAENFFGILKTECIYRHKQKSFDEVRQMIHDYIYSYNNERIQLKTKLTPLEKRCQFG